MLAPETLFFEQRALTEKKSKLKEIKDCISEKGKFHFRSDDHIEPVITQKLTLAFIGKSTEIQNEIRLSIENDTEYYQVENMKSIAAILFSRDFFKTFLLQGM